MTNDSNPSMNLSSAAVVESSLVAFGAGMSAQSRIDVKNSFLFATLVANKLHDQTVMSESWFTSFLQVMGDCGWVVAHRTHEKESTTEQSLKVANVAVKAVQSAATSLLLGGPVTAAIKSLAEAAIKGLETNQPALTVFKRNLERRSHVVVGLASCTETESGEVVMALGAIQRTVRKEDVDVLVFDWDSATSETYKGTAALSFNSLVYASVRAGVEHRLGERALSRIMDYDI
ncbi:hypothetical protein [Pseudomonas huaxiensis]|uniref:hypothetical protein n=1 Tax=Pseudomonas huaxiensis TaxID=2213017 RepID=UPI000DA663B8|nr:hypothetical protein [Pseudomonas huaxiensis]